MATYRVVEIRQSSFMQTMSSRDLEHEINANAQDPWVLDRIIAGETARFMGFGDKDVFLLIFKAPDGTPPPPPPAPVKQKSAMEELKDRMQGGD